MKKVLAALLLTLAVVPAMAQHWHSHGFRQYGHYNHHVYHSRGGGWIAPLIIGGVVGAAIANRPTTQTETVIVQQPSVIVQQPSQTCTHWTETQHSDGTITRTRTCTQ
jgi:hypothetical protein